jgi:hypothetical protein
MEINPIMIRRKLALYNKKPSVRLLLDDPTMILYFDSSLYRPLLGDEVDGDVLATFPNGMTLDAQGASAMPEVEAGLLGGQLILAPADVEEELPARLLYLADDDNSTLEAIDDLFGAGSWTVFVGVNDLDDTAENSSIIDFNDGSNGFFRIDVDTNHNISVAYQGSELGAESFLSGLYDAGDECWICVRKDVNTIQVIINGEIVATEVLTAPSGLSVIQGAIGGRFSFSTVDSVLNGKLSMLAILSESASDTQLGRLKRRVELINRSTVYAELSRQNVAPEFGDLPTLSGGSLPDAPVVGEVLTVGSYVVTGFPVPDITFQWTADGVDISGETEDSYTVLVGDVGAVLACEVTATNVVSAVTETSPDTLAVEAA